MSVRASEVERRELNDLFAALCRIESPSGRERGCADRVAAELRALGLDVSEDDAGAALGGDCGNLLAEIPAPASDRPTLLLCAHLDTVPLTAPVRPVLVDGGWENEAPGILGADNKAAVAVILGRRATGRRAPARPSDCSCCSRSARRPRSPARPRSTRRGCTATTATCSTTPRRSAR